MGLGMRLGIMYKVGTVTAMRDTAGKPTKLM
jgi:hypothetical protein